MTMNLMFPPSAQARVAVAIHGVVVHHPDRLHESITDSGAHELEPAPQEVLAQRVRLLGARRDLLEGAPAVHLGLPPHEGPEIGVEGPELALDLQEGPGVPDRARHLEAVA